MRIIASFLICLLLGSCSAQTSEETFLEKYKAAFNSTGIPYNETLIDISPTGSECNGNRISCAKLPDHYINNNPTSVHKLTPYNIRVIGAVGDSVTAGFGALATKIGDATKEYRGVSWSIGGDEEKITLPNIVKEFNSDVKGFSLKTGDVDSTNAHLNRAVSGAIAKNIPEQVRDLVEKIKGNESIDINEDWKMITVWIGGNDLCAYCKDEEEYSPSKYVNYIREGLDILKAELPRTFVNLVQILDVTELGKMKGLVCGIVHWFACSCKSDMDTSEASREYNKALENMVKDDQYETDDFTVVLQPFMTNLKLPEKDPKSYFGLDCFHFNGKGHCEAARALWNNMMSPESEKDDSINWGAIPPLKCPTEEHPYFFTRKNSLLSEFGAVNPNPNKTQNPSQTGSILGIVLGTGLTVAIAIIVGVVALAYSRHRRRHNSLVRSYTVSMSEDSEKTRLVFSNTH